MPLRRIGYKAPQYQMPPTGCRDPSTTSPAAMRARNRSRGREVELRTRLRSALDELMTDEDQRPVTTAAVNIAILCFMDPIRNPCTPGAGAPPPELAGRDVLREQVRVALE